MSEDARETPGPGDKAEDAGPPRAVTPLAALREALEDYQNPVPREVMAFQIGLAVREASDLEFVPEGMRGGSR